MRLRDLGVFSKPSYEIADLLVQAGITDREQVEDMFYAVLAECAEGTDSDRKAFGRAVQRMRAGDWDTDDAQRAVQAARKRRYRVKSGDVPSDASIDDGDDVSDAERIWQRTLEELKLQMTRGTFNQNLRDTVPLGFDGDVLRVEVKTSWVIDWIKARLQGTINRTISRLAEREIEVKFIVQGDGDESN
jgi:hypothetical protein